MDYFKKLKTAGITQKPTNTYYRWDKVLIRWPNTWFGAGEISAESSVLFGTDFSQNVH